LFFFYKTSNKKWGILINNTNHFFIGIGIIMYQVKYCAGRKKSVQTKVAVHKTQRINVYLYLC